MTTSNQPSAKATLETLSSLYAVFKKQLPLALDTKAQLTQAHPELGAKAISAALRYYTGTTAYLKSAQNASHRYNLQGQEAEEMKEEHRLYAATTLKERFKQRAQIHREAQKAKEAEQKRAAKLDQLMQKFSKD